MVSSGSLSSTGSDSDHSAELHFVFSEDGASRVHRCHCDAQLKLQRDWDPPNSGKRFVRCPYRQEYNCGYFAWIDPIFPSEATTIIKNLVDTKSTLEKHRGELIQRINAKDEEIAMLQFNFAEAKGFSEWLSEMEGENRKKLQLAQHHNIILLQKMKRRNILTALAMAIVSAAICFLIK